LSQSHLAKHHDDTALPLSRQRLPDRRRRVLAHRGIQANAPGRTALGIQLLVIRRALSNYQRHREWDIEEFFRTLKTAGFDIEAADIGDPRVMIKLVAATTIAAITIMQLVKARDGTTDQQVADAFEPDDQPILEALSTQLEGDTVRQKNPHPKGSLAFATWVIARLGGWTGYYGKPGPKVIRRGLDDFRRIKYGTTLRL